MINKWLSDLKNGWQNKDIESILSLFDKRVEYWETPYKKVDIAGLKDEWQAIHSQESINLDLSMYSTQGNRHTVKWKLSYTDQHAKPQNWSGIYLIELDDNNKCTYFYQTGEKI